MDNINEILPTLTGKLARINTIEQSQRQFKIYQVIRLNKEILEKLINIFDNFYFSESFSSPDLFWHGIKISEIRLSGILSSFFFYIRFVSISEIRPFLFHLNDFFYKEDPYNKEKAEEYLLHLLNRNINQNLQSSSDLTKLDEALRNHNLITYLELRFEYILDNMTVSLRELNIYLDEDFRNNFTNELNLYYESPLSYNEQRNILNESDRRLAIDIYRSLYNNNLTRHLNDNQTSHIERFLEDEESKRLILARKSHILTRSLYNKLAPFYERNPQYLNSTDIGKKFKLTRDLLISNQTRQITRDPRPLIEALNNIDQRYNQPGTSESFRGQGENLLNEIKKLI